MEAGSLLHFLATVQLLHQRKWREAVAMGGQAPRRKRLIDTPDGEERRATGRKMGVVSRIRSDAEWKPGTRKETQTVTDAKQRPRPFAKKQQQQKT